jgi:alkylation response protein AidB-like acyl-CoA dehydrogenase
MGVFVLPEFGGCGLDVISYVIAMEELSKAWALLGVITLYEGTSEIQRLVIARQLMKEGVPDHGC